MGRTEIKDQFTDKSLIKLIKEMIQRMGIVSKLLYIKAIENDELPMRITRGREVSVLPKEKKKKKDENFIGVALMDFHVSPEGNTWS